MATTVFPQLNDGDQVGALDFEKIYDGARTLVGASLAAILGIPTAIPMRSPFTVTASGSSMAIAIGGAGGQGLYIDSTTGPRYVDAVPTASRTIPAANTQPRNDLLIAQYARSLANVGSRNNEATDGSKGTVTAHDEGESLTYDIVQGTPAASPVDPVGSVPSGWIPLARIVVPGNATAISQGNITIIPPTMQGQILAGITASGYVDLTSNQNVGGNKTFTGTTTIGGLAFVLTDTNQNGTPSIRRNPAGSIIISPGAPGNGIYVGFDCPTLSSINFGPINRWGFIAADGYHSPDGSAVYGNGVNVGNGYIRAGANNVPLYFAPAKGDLVADRGDGSGIVYLGNNQSSPGSRYLYCNTTGDYIMPGGSLYINGAFITNAGAFAIQNGGQVTPAGVQYGNTSATNALTQLGANNANVSGVVGNLFSIGSNSGATLFVVDAAGIVGVNSDLHANGSIYAAGANLSQGARIGVSAGTPPNGGDLCVTRNSSTNTGYIFFGNTNPAYLGYDGTVVATNVGISSGGAINAANGVYAAGVDLTKGQSYPIRMRPNAGNASYTLTLPALPGSAGRTYQLKAFFDCGDLASGVLRMTGSGASWEAGSVTAPDTGQVGIQTIGYIGTAVGGQSPSVTLSIPPISSPNYFGVFEIVAIAV